MRYFTRQLEGILEERLGQFPVVVVTGPRQSGKTTMVRETLGDWRYVTLEDFDQRRAAVGDPRAFLRRWGPETIIDEFQRAPELVSYLQGIVDAEGRVGQYVLTGSQSYVLHEQLSQSLAGRVGLLVLQPFSGRELAQAEQGRSVWETLLVGGFPRPAVNGVPPEVWYPSYVATYVERDVRQVVQVRDLMQFQRFMRLVATRVGQLLNVASLSRDAGVSVPTITNWLSVLEAGHVLVRLPPWLSSARKRLVRSPKLYFVDTGLLCHLLSIYDAAELSRHRDKGAVFENWVVMESLKSATNRGLAHSLAFWRDTDGNEVDLLASALGRMVALEAKSTETATGAHTKGLDRFQASEGLTTPRFLAYAGSHRLSLGTMEAIPWDGLDDALEEAWDLGHMR